MVLEIADIRVKPGRQAAFEEAAEIGLSKLFPQAKGFRGHAIQRSVESPDRYVLLLEWDMLEDHTLGFRGTPLHDQWRALIGDHLAQSPYVEHFERASGDLRAGVARPLNAP